MATSTVRQNYHQESEAGVNKQINLELYASYVYLSMVSKNKLIFWKQENIVPIAIIDRKLIMLSLRRDQGN